MPDPEEGLFGCVGLDEGWEGAKGEGCVVEKGAGWEGAKDGWDGAKGDGCETLYKFGIDAIFDTVPGIMSLEAAMEHAKENLEQTAENVLRLFFAGQENRLR